MRPRVYLFEELAADLPRPPMCALRALQCSGVYASPSIWPRLTPESRRSIAGEGVEEHVQSAVIMEALRGIDMAHIRLVAKHDPKSDLTPLRSVAEAMRQQNIATSVWPQLSALDRFVLNRVSANVRLLNRALREIAIAAGVPVGATSDEPTLLARCEIVFPTGTVVTLRSAGRYEGRAFLLARVAGVRAARAAPTLLDRHAETLVGPVELEWTTWGDRVLWQAHVSASDGDFLPWVSALAASSAAIALCDMAADGARSAAMVEGAAVREDRWVVGGDDDFEESTQVHGRIV